MRVTLLILASVLFSVCLATDTASGASYAASPLAHLGAVVSLAQVLNPNHYSLFPGDPTFNLSIWDTIAVDGYKLEHITSLGTHTGTHISAPCHFIEGPQYLCIDQLPPSAFVFVAAMLDLTGRIASDPRNADFQVSWDDILKIEHDTEQKIPRDAMVMLYTGFGPKFGTPAYSNNPFPGFSEEAVQRLFKERHIKGTGSDTWGPDASNDDNFIGSNTTYANGGVTIENMNNLHLLKGRKWGDLMMGAPTKLKNGSGYQTNVLAFLP